MITVFTPTYNRGYIISELYESLTQQTFKNFEWLIVDDGSTDKTAQVIKKFAQTALFEIRYIHQENQGKHVAINTGCQHAKGDLFFIVDSDDFLGNNAIEVLNEKFNKIKDNPTIAGIAVGCFSITTGKRIFTKDLPKSENLLNHNELVYKYGIKGDFATAFKTEIQKQFPYPTFPNEKFFRESLVYRRIGKKYKTLYINDPIYFADYLEDGLTSRSWQHLKNSPKGASLFFKELSNENIPFKARLVALNAYWDFQLNDIKSSWIEKFSGVSKISSVIVLLNRKLKLIKL